MTIINSKCGKYSVNIIENGSGGSFLAVANMNDFNSDTMTNQSYWFTIGRNYKTLKSAIRQATKQMSSHNIELVIA